MGEKTPEEGGGNQAARSARLKKEREAAEAARRAAAKQPMKASTMNKSERQLRAEADIRASKMPGGYGGMTASKAAMGARASAIEELTARRDDTRNPISRMNLDNQIRELKAGGTPVQTTFAAGGSRAGEVLTVGVVRGGRFSGRQGFDPSTGATKMNRFAGAYTTRAGTRGGVSTGGDSSPTRSATAPSTPEPVITPISQGPSMSEDAARRAMMSSGAGAATRRKYINR